MRSIGLIALCGGLLLGAGSCTTLYSVESAPGSSKLATLGYYRLPRTDLKLESQLSVKTVVHGEYYCYGQANGVGSGKCEAKPPSCKPDDELSASVESLSLTPTTVPDEAHLFAFQVPRCHETAKRKSGITTNAAGILTGAQSEYESQSGRIALAAIGTAVKTATTVMKAVKPMTDATCAKVEDVAKAAAAKILKNEECIRQLQGALVRGARTATLRACQHVAQLAPRPAIATLSTEAAELRAKFSTHEETRNYSVERWIRVEKSKPAPNEVQDEARLVLGEENAVHMCLRLDKKTYVPRVELCSEGDEDAFFRAHLTRSPGSVDPGLPPQVSTPFGEGGLVYRVPMTALLHVQVTKPPSADSGGGSESASEDATPAGTDGEKKPTEEKEKKVAEEESEGEKSLVALQVKPVTFAQLGPFSRAPREIRARKGHIHLEVSPETGMLTKVEMLREPEAATEEAAAAGESMQSLATTEADMLEYQNRLLRLRLEQRCLEAGNTECSESSGEE